MLTLKSFVQFKWTTLAGSGTYLERQRWTTCSRYQVTQHWPRFSMSTSQLGFTQISTTLDNLKAAAFRVKTFKVKTSPGISFLNKKNQLCVLLKMCTPRFSSIPFQLDVADRSVMLPKPTPVSSLCFLCSPSPRSSGDMREGVQGLQYTR